MLDFDKVDEFVGLGYNDNIFFRFYLLSMNIKVWKFNQLLENIKIQIAENSPWDWLKTQLLLKKSSDIWVQAVKENLSSVLLDDTEEFISYGCFWNEGELFKNIIESAWFNCKKTFTGIYLFTVERYQNQGYAKKLKQLQIQYIREKYPDIKYLLWTTSTKKLLDLYIKYWAKPILSVDRKNKLLIDENINKDYFYYYKI